MEIYSKAKRDFIVALKDVTLPKDAAPVTPGIKTFNIKPEMVVEVSDALAARLIKQYPKEIVEWGKK